MATRLTRIDKTSSRSLVFSILAGRDCHSRVADKRCGTGAKPGRDGHFFLQTNKRVDIYIVARGHWPTPSFSRKPPSKGAPITLTGFGFGGGKGKTVENIAQDC